MKSIKDKADRNLRRKGRITLRHFVLLIIALSCGWAAWQRTSDAYTSALTSWVVFDALERHVGD